MPKMKTRKSAAKRYKLTGSGKLVRKKSMRNHNLMNRSGRRKRDSMKMGVVSDSDLDRLAGQLPYLKYLR